MTMTEDKDKIAEWLPLMMENRTSPVPVAVSRDESGTDVNFGALTRKLFNFLEENGVQVEYEHQVLNIKQQKTALGK